MEKGPRVNLTGLQQVVLIVFTFFCVFVPVFVRIGAALVRLEEITWWGCIKGGMGGFLALGAAVKITVIAQGGLSASATFAIAFGLMALFWATYIQMFMHTSIPQAFGIWFVSHAGVAATSFVLNQFIDLQAQAAHLIALKS
jgi:hypothetical protein